MTKRNIGLGAAAVGALLLIVAVFADAIGLSNEASQGFGTRQILGTVAGAVLLAAGVLVAFVLGRND